MRPKILLIVMALVAVLTPLASRGAAQGESLKDDVFAMIATSEILNTMIVIDTSEQTNAFAYSGYIDTCNDAQSKLSKSISMCWQAYNDCAETNANLMCGASLDCSSTLQKCNTLEANKIKLDNFCAMVKHEDRYGEPAVDEGVTDNVVCDPNVDPASKACRFIGPWTPNEMYDHDLCFYDWTADSGADIPNTDDYSYSQYGNCILVDPSDPASGCKDMKDLPDRRDWLCLSDDGSSVLASGLWLNWRFATSLDAIKILLADDHRFSYTPHRRGQVTGVCRTRQWQPTGEGGQCWEYVNYATLSTEDKKTFQSMVRTQWVSTIKPGFEDNGKDYAACVGFAPVSTEGSMVSQPPTVPNAGCQQCFDRFGAATGCDEEKTYPFNNQPTDPPIVTAIASNLRSDCRVFHCRTPRCRDDVETNCYAGLDPDPVNCPLGFYSEWDQDPEHCCDPVGSGFDCVEEGGGGGGSYMPGPHKTTYVDREADFANMEGVLTDDQFFSLAELEGGFSTTVACVSDADCTVARVCNTGTNLCTGTSVACDTNDDCVFTLCDAATATCVGGSAWRVTDLLPSENLLESVKVEMFYGCIGAMANTKFYEDIYTPSPTLVVLLPNAIPVSGCDTKGYKVRLRLWVVHKGTSDGLASAQLDAQMKISYIKADPSVLDVFKPTVIDYFEGDSWEQELSAPTSKVKEYECETTFYRMRSKVVSGGGGSCDTPQCDVVGGCSSYPSCVAKGNCTLPYPGCTRKEIIAIGKDQWGSVTKSLCTWLCPDAPEYEDVWKCMGYFEANDTSPYPNGGSGPQGDTESTTYPPLDRVPCRPLENTVFECCRGLGAGAPSFSSYYEILETFDTNTYKDIETGSPTFGTSGNWKCGMAHFQEGIANNERRKTGGISVQITRGHINELPEGGAYLLSPILDSFEWWGASGPKAPSPYKTSEDADGWYSAYTLPRAGSSAISASNISVFHTGENGTRDTACIYNIVQDLYGEDCDTCGMGCCMVDMGDIDYCSFPSFWIKVAKTDGGNLVLPLPAGHPLRSKESPLTKDKDEAPSPLVGSALLKFQERVRNLRGVGGATLGETLYDVWRYLGGLKPAYTDSKTKGGSFTTYQSPIQGNPHCFINNAILISGGQPNFDSNTTMDEYGGTANFGGTLPAVTPAPFVEETPNPDDYLSTQTPYVVNENKPYYVENWYKTSLPEVANFVHTVDAYHSEKDCRTVADPCNYRFGVDKRNIACDGAKLSPACAIADTSGDNFIERLDTVGIGSWALAPIYAIAGNDTGYLDADDIMVSAAQGGGKFYGLTAGATVSNSQQETFLNLSQIFNALSAQYPGTFGVGKPHWTSSPIQPMGKYQEAANSVAFMPGVVPISQRLSRFWFGNLKKYYAWSRPTSGDECLLGKHDMTIPGDDECEWLTFSSDDLLQDCFNFDAPAAATNGTDPGMTDYNKVLQGGVAANLAVQAGTCGTPPCYREHAACVWSSAAQCRIIYTDNGAGPLVNFASIPPGDLVSRPAEPYIGYFDGISTANAVTILDYVYGYDSVDHNGDGDLTQNRATELPALEKLSDPFVSGATIDLSYSILGAAVHSKPLAVYYSPSGATPTEADLRIFYGANDGLLHCFDGVETAGHPNERWAYMPAVVRNEMPFILSGLDAVSFNSIIDGPMTLFHVDSDVDGFIDYPGEAAFLIIAYRRGVGVNSAYTILDISDPANPELVKHLSISGQSWSAPALFRMGGTGPYYLAFGGGYDPCVDADSPLCGLPDNDADCVNDAQCDPGYKCDIGLGKCRHQIKGNQIHIYEYNGNPSSPDFSLVKTFAHDPADDHLKWLVAPVAAEGVAVNTNGPLFTKISGIYSGNVEMLYFVDVTGTIFRVYHNGTDWQLRTVMTMRAQPAPEFFNFGQGVRSYYSFMPSPKFEQFTKMQIDHGGDGDMGTANDVFIVPVPLVTGNIVYPREAGVPYEILVLYDRLPNPPGGTLPGGDVALTALYSSADFKDMTDRETTNDLPFRDGGNTYDTLHNGYRIDLRPNVFSGPPDPDTGVSASLEGEKNMAAPLVYYNWDEDTHALFATTYATQTGLNECSNSGESFLYCRNLPTGDTILLDDRYAKCAACNVIGLGKGLAQTPSVLKGIRQPNDEVVVVAVGADLKTESSELPPPPKTIKILKWYELY